MKPSASPLQQLIERGVIVPHPSSVYVDESVDPDRVAAGVVLHPGTRLLGRKLTIGPGCEIGGEAPATVEDCVLGHKVALKGGFFQGSVFLDGSSMGSSAHVRAGCLLEEEASGAHAVGLKQTILFPFVTLGSLINFCDVLMAGGTSRRNHSEVGSSFIHFNFTPHGDKATASLIGDVPRGVLLDQAPIFLGGQGGIVGPIFAEYGVVLAAGSISRENMNDPHHLYQTGGDGKTKRPYAAGAVKDFGRRLGMNLQYIGNLLALRVWYKNFRAPAAVDFWRRASIEAADRLLSESMHERIKQLEKYLGLAHRPQEETEELLGRLRVLAEDSVDDPQLCNLAPKGVASHLAAVAALTPEQRNLITERLEAQVRRVTDLLSSSTPRRSL